MAVAQQEIEQAETLALQGNAAAAVALLSKLIQRDSSNVAAWLALSEVVDDPERAEYCLRKVLNLDPDNAAAQAKLSSTEGGSLSVGSLSGLNQRSSMSAEDLVPAAGVEASQNEENLGSEQTPSELGDPLDELPTREAYVKPSTMEEDVGSRPPIEEAPDVPARATFAETSSSEPIEPEDYGSYEFQAQVPSAIPAQVKGSSIGRIDLILIGLTVLAGIVLCALVSAALIG